MKTIACLLCGALLLLVVGCSSSAPEAALARPAVDSVRSTPAPAQPLPTPFMAMGPVVVEQQIDVAAQRDGLVTEINVDIDSRVKKGQLLARLDDRQLLAERDAADHKLRSIEADVKNWEMQLKVREVDLRRSEALLINGINTQQQVDHDRYSLTATQYELDRERENAMNSSSTTRSMDLELEKTRIRAPFDGIIARRYVRLGQRVSSGDKMFWVTALGPLQVRFTLPEQYSRSLKPGDEVEVIASTAGSNSLLAKVAHVSPVIDPASGTVEVIAVMNTSASLRPGMTASIRIPR